MICKCLKTGKMYESLMTGADSYTRHKETCPYCSPRENVFEKIIYSVCIVVLFCFAVAVWPLRIVYEFVME